MDTSTLFYVFEIFYNNHHRNRTKIQEVLSSRRVFQTIPVNRFYSPSILYVLKCPQSPLLLRHSPSLIWPVAYRAALLPPGLTSTTWHLATLKVLLSPKHSPSHTLMLLLVPLPFGKFLLICQGQAQYQVLSKGGLSPLHLLLCTCRHHCLPPLWGFSEVRARLPS